MPKIAVERSIWCGSILQDVLKRVGRRSHIEVKELASRLHEAGSIHIVIFLTVSGYVFPANDTFARVQVAGEGQTSHPVAFCRDRLISTVERQQQVVHPMIVAKVH